MKILCVSDTVVSQMENAAHLRRRYNDVDMLISCGDMPSAYLEFITSVLNIPLFYVRGNHDTSYTEMPPGGEDLHGQLVQWRGIRLFGLEGSIRYNNGPIQYTEGQYRTMVYSKIFPFGLKRLTSKEPVMDIFVTHASPRGIHDREDLPHQGISAFLTFMDLYHPRYMVHGHVHTYDRRDVVKTQYHDTIVMNINPVTLLEIEAT